MALRKINLIYMTEYVNILCGWKLKLRNSCQRKYSI